MRLEISKAYKGLAGLKKNMRKCNCSKLWDETRGPSR